MGVIVKGMKMPKNCLHCDFDDSYGICACRNEAPYVCEYSAKQRPSWCPLEEVPSAQPETHEERTETHACDLIDRQAAIDALDCISGVEEVLRSLPSAQSEPIRINLNEPIKVKLTDWGKEIYYHQYDRTNQIAGREICKPMFPREDENGYTEFQLWCFIELYGMHMGMTLPNVIEPLEIVYER